MTLQQLLGNQLLKLGSSGPAVTALQLALSQAGYRVDQDGIFGPGTDSAVRRFQTQHGLTADGIVGPVTVALLDQPHETLVSTAAPVTIPVGEDSQHYPHDDTASLLAFYGKPWENSSLLIPVNVPFAMTYRQDNGVLLPIPHITFHKKAAGGLASALGRIADFAKGDPTVLKHVKNFSGSYNYRPVRGSSRLSCHAFGAAIDFDAEHLPLGRGVPASEMPASVVDAFKSSGAFWGGDYQGRKDPMHFQWAHE